MDHLGTLPAFAHFFKDIGLVNLLDSLSSVAEFFQAYDL